MSGIQMCALVIYLYQRKIGESTHPVGRCTNRLYSTVCSTSPRKKQTLKSKEKQDFGFLKESDKEV